MLTLVVVVVVVLVLVLVIVLVLVMATSNVGDSLVWSCDVVVFFSCGPTLNLVDFES